MPQENKQLTYRVPSGITPFAPEMQQFLSAVGSVLREDNEFLVNARICANQTADITPIGRKWG
jgi:hypothetical protein